MTCLPPAPRARPHRLLLKGGDRLGDGSVVSAGDLDGYLGVTERPCQAHRLGGRKTKVKAPDPVGCGHGHAERLTTGRILSVQQPPELFGRDAAGETEARGGLAGPVARLGLVPVVVLVEAFGHLLYVIVGPARAESGDRRAWRRSGDQEPLGAATEGTDNGRGHAQPFGGFGRAVTDDTRQEHGRRRLGRDTAGPDGGADFPRQRIGGRATRPCGELAEAVEVDVMGGGPELPTASVPGTRPTLGPPAQGRAAVAEPLRQRSRPRWRPPPPSTGSQDRPGEPPDRQGWHRTGASSKRLR